MMLAQKQALRIPSLWAKLVRRLMALPDGEHILFVQVEGGRVTWRFLHWGKNEAE